MLHARSSFEVKEDGNRFRILLGARKKNNVKGAVHAQLALNRNASLSQASSLSNHMQKKPCIHQCNELRYQTMTCIRAGNLPNFQSKSVDQRISLRPCAQTFCNKNSSSTSLPHEAANARIWFYLGCFACSCSRGLKAGRSQALWFVRFAPQSKRFLCQNSYGQKFLTWLMESPLSFFQHFRSSHA